MIPTASLFATAPTFFGIALVLHDPIYAGSGVAFAIVGAYQAIAARRSRKRGLDR